MQPIEIGRLPHQASVGAACQNCGVVLAPALLVCPNCNALVHRSELEVLARTAEQASRRGELADAMASWRKALELLPPQSKQAARITELIRELREKVETLPSAPTPPGSTSAQAGKTGWKRWGAAVSSA